MGPTGTARADEAARLAFFEAKIRPALIAHCYECHSADADEAAGGLLLDSAAGVTVGGDSGPAVVAGDPDASPLIEAIRYDGVEMPPSGRLPADVVKDFETWVRDGAADPRTDGPAPPAKVAKPGIDPEEGRRFWAFQPVVRPPVPRVADAAWPESEVDAFILAGLERAGLAPAPEADRRTLIRRLAFDLTGLPPTPEQVTAFVADGSPEALPRLVDRLLASEAFAVRFGRHWLDVARYADSNGNDFNATFHDAWKYRDYVLTTFAEDRPFDRFIRQQIAGDLLPAATDAERAENVVATGFLMAGTKMLSERDKAKLTMDVVDEQVNTVGQAVLGLTLGCARCHDHKFDPIPTADYYALAGIFKSTETLKGESQQYVSTWPRRELPAPPEQVAAVRAHEATLKTLDERIKALKKARDAKIKERDAAPSAVAGLIVDDGAAVYTGAWTTSERSAERVGAGYRHDNREGKGQKRAVYTLTPPATADYDVQLSYNADPNRSKAVPVVVAQGATEARRTLDQTAKPPIEGLYASVGTVRLRANEPATVTLETTGTAGYVIADAVRLVELDDAGQPVDGPAAGPAAAGRAAIEKALAAAEASLEAAEAERKAAVAAAPPALPTAFAVTEAASIGDCAIRVRGEHANLGPAVPRGTLSVVAGVTPPEITSTESGRRGLADWLADPNNPLTARVYVNRVWQAVFGQGIVPTADNFGRLGDRPSHPELLDELAWRFVREGWSTKALVRRLVLTKAYRMSSRHDEAAWTADPDNRLLWRANRRRLPAEALRDGLLAISGDLDEGRGGSPVDGMGVLVTVNNADQGKFERAESNRRSVYLPILRGELPPILTVFDFADPDLVVGQRTVTNVPAQALLLLNSPFVMDRAERTAGRIAAGLPGREAGGTDADRTAAIVAAYERTLARPPSPAEVDRAAAFLDAAARDGSSEAGPTAPKDGLSPLAQLVLTLFASTEFRIVE